MARSKFVVLFFAFTLLVLSYQNCAEYDLKMAQVPKLSVNSNISFCTTPSDAIKSNLKFIFVVDRSGSNQEDFNLLPDGSYQSLPGTDPTGDRRFSALETFIQNFNSGEDQYTYWSLVTISTQGRMQRDFTNDRNGFYNYIVGQHANSPNLDGGYTNFLDSLDEVKRMIERDVQKEKQKPKNEKVSSNYVVFFVSDGEPIIGPGQRQKDNDLKAFIESFHTYQEENKELVDGIQLNSAYYYSDLQRPSASNTLSGMATVGRGSFLEFAKGETIDFTKFAIPIRISKFALKEFWFHNANTIWEGEALKRDSDADGLSNELEEILGSDPKEYDTDNNGVGDGVEYRISGSQQACQYADCRKVNSAYQTCVSLLKSSSKVEFGDEDNDYLNDCEERLLGSDFQNPDSNFDYIPDHLAFVNNINLVETSNSAYLDPDNDGVTDYYELKQNTPLRVHNDKINGEDILEMQTRLLSQSVEQECYGMDVLSLPFFSKTDSVRAYIMENTQTLNEKRIMRTTEKPLNNGGVFIVEEDFK